MFFTKTHIFQSPVTKDDLKNRLIGNHVKIHDLDFEIIENEHQLSIIPHAEQINEIKTLPVTSVVMSEAGGKTRVVITSKMRQLDSGGPMLILIFCSLMLIASAVLFQLGNEPAITFTLLGISVLIFTVFWIRLEMGYFDYVRKIRAYVKSKVSPQAATTAGMPMAQA